MKKCFLLFALMGLALCSRVQASSFEEDFSGLSTERLSNADLMDKSADELMLMQKAIYAKYGFDFQGGDLQDYFSQYDWYEPTTGNEFVVYSQMNAVEQYNIGRINLITSEGKVVNVAWSYYSYPSNLSRYYYSVSDFYGMNCWELRVLRNAIYAKYGYIFKSNDLWNFFSSCSWYYPRYKSESKVYKMMSNVEKKNIETIKKRERQLGC